MMENNYMSVGGKNMGDNPQSILYFPSYDTLMVHRANIAIIIILCNKVSLIEGGVHCRYQAISKRFEQFFIARNINQCSTTTFFSLSTPHHS